MEAVCFDGCLPNSMSLLSVENVFSKGPKPAGPPQLPLRKSQFTSGLSTVSLRDVQHFYINNE